MSEIPRCAQCQAVLMPGAPFCTSCWAPLDVPAAAETPAAAEPAAGPAMPAVPDTVPAEWTAAPVAAAPAGGFFGGPPPAASGAPDPFAPPPGMPLGWRPPVDPNAVALAPPSSGRSVKVVTIAVLAGLVGLLLTGGWFGYRAATKDESKSRAATVFREGDGGPLGDMMVGGSREAALASSPAERAAVAAWLPTVEPAILEMNAAIGEMQTALDQWAAGKLDAGGAAKAAKRFEAAAQHFTEAFEPMRAPEFLYEDVANLVKGAIDYGMAADALLSIIDGRKGIKQMGFGITAGAANLAWDTGIETLYLTAGRQPAYRPNKP